MLYLFAGSNKIVKLSVMSRSFEQENSLEKRSQSGDLHKCFLVESKMKEMVSIIKIKKEWTTFGVSNKL